MPAQRYPLTLENQAFAYCRAFYYCQKFSVPDQLHEDVQQEALLASLIAETRFEHARGVKFITYAGWWIDRAVKRYLMRHRQTVRFAANVARDPHNGVAYNPDVESLTRRHDQQPAEYAIAALVDHPHDTPGIHWHDIRNCLALVPEERSRRVLLERAFGRTYQAIGDDLNLSRERVRQLHNEAIQTIREAA